MSSSVKAALLANGSVAIAKTIGAFITGSASMVAESIHSFADCGNQLLLLWGMKASKRDADKEHPLGYGMNLFFWSFIVALVLFFVGGAYSVYEGVHKLAHPEPLHNLGWAIGIMLFGFIVEAKSFMICLREIREEKKDKSIFWFFKETRSSHLLIIFCEDFAALLGLGVALTFLIIAAVTNDPIWDAVGSIGVGSILIAVSVFLFVEIKQLLIGQSVDPIIRSALHKYLYQSELVEHTYECITLQVGAEAVLMLRVRMREKEDALKLIDDINMIEKEIATLFPEFTTIFVEPDNKFEDF